ncbi:MAG: sulfur carrier protein ThiS [Terriglobales bacterium]
MKLLINGEERSFDDPLTLAALVEQLGVKADRVAVELNHVIVRRDAWGATKLRDGDHLEVVHFVGGGAAVFPTMTDRTSSNGGKRNRYVDWGKTALIAALAFGLLFVVGSWVEAMILPLME